MPGFNQTGPNGQGRKMERCTQFRCESKKSICIEANENPNKTILKIFKDLVWVMGEALLFRRLWHGTTKSFQRQLKLIK
jgi:hypothetical protein